jgi:hypothetical protein
LIESASTSMLNAKASTLWISVMRRISREVACTSDTCEVMPITYE